MVTRGGFCAIQFKGADGVSMPFAGVVIPTTTVTASISVIVNPTSTTDSRILSFSDGGVASDFAILYGRTANKYSCFGRTSAAGLIQLDTTDTFSTGTPHNVICTAQQSNISIYVDGVFEGSNLTLDTAKTFGVLSLIVSSTCAIGVAPGNVSAFLTGIVDDVRVYNRILSSGEISTIGKSVSRVLITDGYLAYWPLDNGAFGATSNAIDILDRSGKGQNGALFVGTPRWGGSSYVNYP